MKYLLAVLLFLSNFFLPLKDQDIQTKIGVLVKANSGFSRLRTNDIVRKEDQMRIFIKPLTCNCFLYVLYDDFREVNLLTSEVKYVKRFDMLSLPSENEYYRFDGKTKKVRLILISSKCRIDELDQAFKSNRSIGFSKWETVEMHLAKLAKLEIKDETTKPFTIAGNVRGSVQDFINTLPAFTGNPILIKTYDIEIKK